MAAHPLQEEYPLQEEHPLQEEFDNFSQLKVYNVVVFGNCGAGTLKLREETLFYSFLM
jgi:hypothetical protein